MEYATVGNQRLKNHNIMKQLRWIGLVLITGIAGIMSLSSFQNQGSMSSELPDEKQTSSYLHYRSAFENPYYLRDQRTGHFYAEVKGGELNSGRQQVPLNLAVVIDRSGSMAGEKIQFAKEAARYLVDQLSPDDYISIIAYDGSVDVIQESVPVSNKYQIKSRIDMIFDRGSTNLMGGAMAGYEQVKKHFHSAYINRVLLLSDGLANVGITDPLRIRNIVRTKNEMDGISISTFGVGRDYNEDLMTAMAENGSGNYYFIDRSTEIPRIFRDEIRNLNEVAAQQVQLKIQIPDFVQIEKVYGCNYQQNGRVLTVQLHDVFENETKGILIRYSVQQGMNLPVQFYSSLSYMVGDSRRKQHDFSDRSDFTNNRSLFQNSFNDWVSAQVALYESNEMLESAMKEVDKGNYREARELVKKNDEYMRSKPAAVQQSNEWKQAAGTNADYHTKLDNVESLSEDEVKYMQKDSKNTSYKLRNKK